MTSLALMPDGLRFVSGSDDKTARIAYHGFEFGKKDEAKIGQLLGLEEGYFHGMPVD